MHSEDGSSSRLKILNNPLLLLMSATAISLYFSSFQLPLTPIWAGTDQFGFIVYASRLWEGETFYRQIFYVTPPGHEVIYLLFFRLFGQRNWIPNMDLVLIGLVLIWLVAYIGRKLIQPERALALLPALLFFSVPFARSLQDSHRWLSSAGLLTALAALLDGRTLRRLAIAGAFCGIASFFTQTQGVIAIAGLVIFLAWEMHTKKTSWGMFWKQTFCLLASFVATVIVTDVYFVWKAGVRAFLFWTIHYPAVYFPHGPAGSFQVYLSEIPRGGSFVPLLRGVAPFVFIYVLVPFIYLAVFVWYGLRGATNEDGLRVMLVNVFGLCSFAGVARSPTYFRLCTVSVPALILLVYFLQGRRPWQRVAIALLWIAPIFTLVHRPILVQRSIGSVLELPRGPIAFLSADSDAYQLVAWLSANTHPGELCYSASIEGILYPLALRTRPISLSSFDDWGTAQTAYIQETIENLQSNRVRLVLLTSDGADASDPLRSYVEKNYHLVKCFDCSDGGQHNEIWQRNE